MYNLPPNLAMPQAPQTQVQGGGIPFAQNPMITALGASLLGGGTWAGAGNLFGQMAPAAMATNYAMRRDNKEQAEQAQVKAAWNAALLAKSQGKPIPPDAQAIIFGANPNLAASHLFPEKSTPYTEVGKAKEDLDNGRITPEQYNKIAGGGPDAASVANITAIRKEADSKPGTSRYRTSQPILSSMIQSVDDTSAMSDLDFVYGMAKIFDPDSVVRESEMGMVLEGQSLPQWVTGLFDKVAKGEQVLQPQARRDLVKVSMTRVGEYRKQATAEGEFFTGVSTRQGIDPQNVVQPLSPMPAWTSTAGVPSAMGAPPPPPTGVVPWTEFVK